MLFRSASTKQTLSSLGRAMGGLIVHHDQDPVYTSYAWTSRLLIDDGVRISYALRGARDNPEMESFFGRFKVENHSLFLDAQDLDTLRHVVAGRIRYHNHQRRHSTLNNRSPVAFLSIGGEEQKSQS